MPFCNVYPVQDLSMLKLHQIILMYRAYWSATEGASPSAKMLRGPL